jgi:hypothetical protein
MNAEAVTCVGAAEMFIPKTKPPSDAAVLSYSKSSQ